MFLRIFKLIKQKLAIYEEEFQDINPEMKNDLKFCHFLFASLDVIPYLK